MNYAMIKNGVIDNIIVADYTMANMIAMEIGSVAINCDNYPVTVGDIYENGSFMNANAILDENGNILIPARTVIERKMTDEEYIYKLEQENKELKKQTQDLQIALAEIMGV